MAAVDQAEDVEPSTSFGGAARRLWHRLFPRRSIGDRERSNGDAQVMPVVFPGAAGIILMLSVQHGAVED